MDKKKSKSREPLKVLVGTGEPVHLVPESVMVEIVRRDAAFGSVVNLLEMLENRLAKDPASLALVKAAISAARGPDSAK